VLAIAVRHRELGIAIAATAGLTGALAAAAAVLTCSCPTGALSAPAIAMPSPSPEPVRGRVTVVVPTACDAPGISTIVFKGQVTSLADDQQATFHFRFADLPSSYAVMTGARGTFEVRIPRDELGATDLCSLPSSGQRPASFRDASLAIHYELSFER
jgi:hypothetical protein